MSHRTYPGVMEDPAFVWQQQDRVARPMEAHAGDDATSSHGPASSTRWVTLHEAEEVTGVPASTVRNWARKERIPTRFELTTEGQVRMVGLDEVVARARHLGRLRPQPAATPTRARPQPAAPPSEAPREAPEGSVLVPIDAWNRMINQLGNLHEAGQQLAEARERAGRAETEALFLRERLAEMRSQGAPSSEPPPVVPDGVPPSGAPQPEPEPQAHTVKGTTREMEPAWLYLYRRWENRTRKRR